MKKGMRLILFASLLFFAINTDVYALETDINIQTLQTDPDYKDIKALEQTVIDEIGAAYFYNTGHLLNDRSDVTIDIKDAYKVYIDGEFFKKIDRFEAIEDRLSDMPVIWYYEIPIDEEIYLVEISKGNEIDESIEWTEEQRAYLSSVAGKWHISGYGYYTNENNSFAEKIEGIDTSSFEHDETVYLVGGMKLINSPALVFSENESPTAVAPLDEIFFEGTPEQIDAVTLDTDDSSIPVYHFEKLQTSINHTRLNDKVGAAVIDLSSSSVFASSVYIPVIVSLTVGSSLFIKRFVKNRKRKC